MKQKHPTIQQQIDHIKKITEIKKQQNIINKKQNQLENNILNHKPDLNDPETQKQHLKLLKMLNK
jgi:hypothetical protein